MTMPTSEPSQEEATESPLGSWIRRIEEVLFAIILIGMMVVGLIPVLARRFFPVGLAWPDPLSRQMVLWIALLGAGAATQARSHIAVDAVTHFLSRRARSGVRALTHFLSAVLSGAFAWFSVAFVRDMAEFEADNIAFLCVREWWLTLALPIGFALLALRLAIACIQDVRKSIRKTVEEGEPA
ncbi:MAG: TRAP transporter small permease [Lentisphaerae bacterium]|jgi:C4-dicarboxylate transporter, DctQ subunit|nr:TRAP transporter small permease [Lentisphaerota bacterium]MBT4816037.1 TRAP transporter small permease [Lentisphaerota bacterium]MBT5606861.1 TRAP transporter small permease [Lentisphaerota bacterium]MBT7059008.1 TRAP transporter small permease [Lentisphaerota bacterium]MBT7843580.1 TRAP transporter small permease [Lentisphaerota bacterium]